MRIGRIAGLWRYPVKSLAGEALQSATVETSGVVGDRAWVLKDHDTDEIVNCKLIPALLMMGATYPAPPQSDAEPIDAVVTLPDGRQILTSNPYAAQAISAFAGRALELWPLQPASNAEHYRLRRAMSPAVTLQRMGMKASDPFPDFSNYEPALLSELQYFATPRGSHIVPTGHDDVVAKHVEFTQDEFRMGEATIRFGFRGGGALERRAHLS